VALDADGRLEARVAISVEDQRGGLLHIEVAIDTGFTGSLALSTELIEQLGLVVLESREMALANGEIVEMEYHYARVVWHGQLRQIGVFESGDTSVLGMQMLNGNRLIIDAWDGGEVIIEEAQPPISAY